MALSNKRILEEMEKGHIIIDPFNPKNLNTSSYDVTLGRYFYRRQKLPWNQPFDNIWNEEHNKLVWGEPEQAQNAKTLFAEMGPHHAGISPNDEVIMLSPGEVILAHTIEYIGGRNHITTMMHSRSSMGRSQIGVCDDAGWGDVGFFNRWTMEIRHKVKETEGGKPIPLVIGRRIAQIIFFETGPVLETDADYAKGGKYQESSEIEVLKRDWHPAMMLPRLYKDRDINK